MGMINQFDLIGDTDVDDPLQIALAQLEISSKKSVSDAAPEVPVKEIKKGGLAMPHAIGRFQGRRDQDGRGRGPGRNFESNRYVNGFSAVPEDSAEELLGKPSVKRHSDQPYSGRGGRGRGYLNRDNGQHAGQPASRQFERRSGLSYPPEKVKGEPAPLVKGEPFPPVELDTADKLPEQKMEENVNLEGKSLIPEELVELDNAPSSNANNEDKEGIMTNGREEKEPEVEVMTLEEYQKVLEEKRRTLVAMKTLERKVEVDKELECMQQLLVKKENNEFFIKLRNDKEAGKRKEDTDRDERVKKSVSINEFLKPAEGERYYGPGGRRGRGGRGGDRGQHRVFGGRGYSSSFSAPSIADPGQFPALGGN